MSDTSPRGQTIRSALVETTHPYRLLPQLASLVDAGYSVTVCTGPRPEQFCPVRDGLRCPLVDDAGIVVNAVDDPAMRAELVRGIRAFAPDVPIAIVGRHRTHVDGTVWHESMHELARQLGPAC